MTHHPVKWYRDDRDDRDDEDRDGSKRFLNFFIKTWLSLHHSKKGLLVKEDFLSHSGKKRATVQKQSSRGVL